MQQDSDLGAVLRDFRCTFGEVLTANKELAQSVAIISEWRNGEPDLPDMRDPYLDATEHPGTVQEYKIMFHPGIVIRGELAYTGSVSDTIQPDWT